MDRSMNRVVHPSATLWRAAPLVPHRSACYILLFRFKRCPDAADEFFSSLDPSTSRRRASRRRTWLRRGRAARQARARAARRPPAWRPRLSGRAAGAAAGKGRDDESSAACKSSISRRTGGPSGRAGWRWATYLRTDARNCSSPPDQWSTRASPSLPLLVRRPASIQMASLAAQLPPEVAPPRTLDRGSRPGPRSGEERDEVRYEGSLLSGGDLAEIPTVVDVRFDTAHLRTAPLNRR